MCGFWFVQVDWANAWGMCQVLKVIAPCPTPSPTDEGQLQVIQFTVVSEPGIHKWATVAKWGKNYSRKRSPSLLISCNCGPHFVGLKNQTKYSDLDVATLSTGQTSSLLSVRKLVARALVALWNEAAQLFTFISTDLRCLIMFNFYSKLVWVTNLFCCFCCFW